jgi:hypothetical protein
MMKNKFSSFLLIAGLLTLVSVLTYSCKKNDIVTPNQEVALFSGKTGSYFVTNSANTVFKIPVGITAIPNADRTIKFTVSSPSGATEGQQYNLGTTSVTIPAGTTVDSIELKGLFSGYASGRKDTLIFKITGGDIPSLVGSDEYTVYMQKYCDVNLADFSGTYTAQDYYQGAPDGGPYTVTLTPGTATGTTGFVTLSGLWGIASPGVKINLDWTDPANFKTSIPTAPWFVHATYGQSTIRPNGTWSFSSCDNTFTIGYEATVSAGSFGKYTTTLTK